MRHYRGYSVNKYGKVMLLIAAIIIMILIVFVVFDAYLTRQAWMAECIELRARAVSREESVHFCSIFVPDMYEFLFRIIPHKLLNL